MKKLVALDELEAEYILGIREIRRLEYEIVDKSAEIDTLNMQVTNLQSQRDKKRETIKSIRLV